MLVQGSLSRRLSLYERKVRRVEFHNWCFSALRPKRGSELPIGELLPKVVDR